MITGIDFQILDFLQQHCRTQGLDKIFSTITHLGDAGIIWILLAAALLLIPKTRRCGIVVSIALILDLILCNGILKNLVARIRPFDVNTAVELLIQKPSDYSFPSGHTAASFAAVTALYCTHSRLRYPAFCVALLIAFSRMYLYVHYPSDILGGVLLGVICGCAAAQIFRVRLRRWNQKRQPDICPSSCTGSCQSCPGNKQ
ncbi:MAG: phosphatase PAP2 family protein [Oscillospiraceae bacterium]|jgi:membrane-associated phospholipid phosphatase